MNSYTLKLLAKQCLNEDLISLSNLLSNCDVISCDVDNVDYSSLSVRELSLMQAISSMRRSHIAELLMQYCAKSDVTIRFDNLLMLDEAVFCEDENIVDIAEQSKMLNHEIHNRRLADMIIALSYGFRKAWQYNRGNIFNPELAVRDLLHLSRSVEADAVVFVTLICWELKEKGSSHPWRQWLAGKNSDVAIAFENTQAENGSAKNMYGLSRALEESYCQWFRNDDRGAASEHMALEKLDRVLLRCKSEDIDSSWIGRKELSAMQWKKIGEIPGFKNYLERGCLLQHGYKKQPIDAFNKAHFQHVLRDISKN